MKTNSIVVSQMSEDMKLRELLIRATKDFAFREKFLKMPEQTAAEMNVKIKPEQLEKIKWAGEFINSLSNLKIWPGPIYYPIDSSLQQWATQEMFSVMLFKKPGPIFYPRMKM